MIRDYAVDSSAEEARAIRRRFHETANTELRSAESVGQILGYSDGRGEDASMEPLGLRTLSRVHVVNDEIAARIVDAYETCSSCFTLQKTIPLASNLWVSRTPVHLLTVSAECGVSQNNGCKQHLCKGRVKATSFSPHNSWSKSRYRCRHCGWRYWRALWIS